MRFREWAEIASASAGGLVALSGVCILIGFAAKWPLVISFFYGGVMMSPITALNFAVLGTAVLLSARRASRRAASAVACVSLLIVATHVLVTMASTRFGLALDTLALDLRINRKPAMAQFSAVNFTLLGVGLLLANARRAPVLFQALFLAALLVAWLGLARFVYTSQPLLPIYSLMSLPTAVLFVLLALGALLARSDTAFTRVLTSDGAGGTVARRLVPATVIVPLALAWPLAYAQRTGWVDPAGALALLALVTVIALATLIWINGALLERLERRREAIQQSLQANEIRTQLLVDSTDDAIITTSLTGVITTWNPGAERLFGYTADQVIGKATRLLLPSDRADEDEMIYGRISRSQAIDHFETVRQRSDGSLIDVSMTISPLKDASGAVMGASKIARDISDRKAHEREMQTQLDRLRLLHEITSAIAERQDVRSIFQVAIRSLEDRLPIDFGCVMSCEASSEDVEFLCVGTKRPVLERGLAQLLPDGSWLNPEWLASCRAGQIVYVPDISGSASSFVCKLAQAGIRSLILAPLQTRGQTFALLIIGQAAQHELSRIDREFLRQLTEHMSLAATQAQLHGALQQAYDDLQVSQEQGMQQERLRVLGQMASGIAHDINNSLSPAALYAQWLLERDSPPLDSEARQQLNIIHRAIGDVAATIARMKEFYRGPGSTARAPLDLHEVLERVIELTRVRWNSMPRQAGVMVTLNTQIADSLPALLGHETEIRDALTNLILNAVDAMPQGGTLTVRAYAPGEQLVCVEIADTGVGMDEATRQKCLEPFFTTKGERGSGLGLAMVYGMAQRHDAELHIDSELGRGTLVRITFRASARDRAGAVVEPLPGIAAKLRILVIDDDPLVLRSVSDVLSQDGHSVTVAEGGEHGIELFSAAERTAQRFSIVLTDLGMPHVDGRQVAAAIKSLAPAVPIVMMTGWGAELSSVSCVDRVLNKPPRFADLRRALSDLTPAERYVF